MSYHECVDCGEEASELWDGVEWLCLECVMRRQDEDDQFEDWDLLPRWEREEEQDLLKELEKENDDFQ